MIQMTQKEAIDLMAYFTLISVTNQGDALLEKYISEEQIDKMMKVNVSLFEGDNSKAEAFIIAHFQRLLDMLDGHEIDENQTNKFTKGENTHE